jgi:MOSC domain-containing protein YiiM
MNTAKVISLSKSNAHTFSKYTCESIVLQKGLGVEGDAHNGEKVKHRSRVEANPDQPNLRQVHLIHSELFQELKDKGFHIKPGDMGENITTQGIDLLNLPKDTILKIGSSAVVQITGLRNPCAQIEAYEKGLLKAMVDKDEEGNLIRKSGIMGIVLEGGEVNVGDAILVEYPPEPFIKMERV